MYELRKKKTTFLFFSGKHRDVLRKSIWETANETRCCASLAAWSIAVKGVNLGFVLVKEKKNEEKCDKLSKPQLGWIKYLQKPMDNAAVIRSTVLPLSIYWVGKERIQWQKQYLPILFSALSHNILHIIPFLWYDNTCFGENLLFKLVMSCNQKTSGPYTSF